MKAYIVGFNGIYLNAIALVVVPDDVDKSALLLHVHEEWKKQGYKQEIESLYSVIPVDLTTPNVLIVADGDY